MNKFKTFIIAVTFLMSTGNAQAIVIADARGDYVPGVNIGDLGIVSATGTGAWNYLASDNVNPTLDGSLDVLDWDVGNISFNHWTTGGSADSVDIQSIGLALDEVRMHPSATGRPPEFDVVRWIAGAGEAGLINISGNVRKVDTGAGGVTFELFVNGISVFSSTLTGSDTVGVPFNHNVTVGVGSTVDFVVGANGDDAFDSTGLKAVITQVPEPSTFALLALGLAGIGSIRRRRVH